MKNDYPLFHNLKLYGFDDELSDDELKYVLYKIFGQPVIVTKGKYSIFIHFQNNKIVYWESKYLDWYIFEYNENNNCIHYEDSIGNWGKYIYDENEDLSYEKSEFPKNMPFPMVH